MHLRKKIQKAEKIEMNIYDKHRKLLRRPGETLSLFISKGPEQADLIHDFKLFSTHSGTALSNNSKSCLLVQLCTETSELFC